MNAKIIFDTTATKSGIYEIVLPAAEPNDAPQTIHIMTDVSGSMDERCKDRNTKMDQIKYVIKNILRFLSTHCPNISLCVSAFNSDVRIVLPTTTICAENLDDLLKKIDKMYACDSTNIELALKALRADPSQALRADPSQALRLEETLSENRHNIMMTDGDANEGETRANLLAELVDVGASNTFIGFGLDHNPHMFTTLSNTHNSSYYFIDQVEKAGIAYGEILHGIVNRVYKCARLVVENGEVYDWKTGAWTTELYIGALASDATKKYHIRSEDSDNIVVRFMEDQTLVCETGFQNICEDLTQMSYRLRTLDLLYRATHANETRRELKTELKAFFDEMTEYMKTLEDTKLMKNLCDDIVVVHRTIGTKYGQMYSSARQCSQGTERIHNASDTPMAPRDNDDDVFSFTPMTRHSRNIRQTNAQDEVEQPDDDCLVWGFTPDILLWGPRTPRKIQQVIYDWDPEQEGLGGESDVFGDYTVSDEAQTPHTSRTATSIIRDISEASSLQGEASISEASSLKGEASSLQGETSSLHGEASIREASISDDNE